mmetsp:Transcript_42403/g.42969  ORF Transcript_42403/g.42969 Transcript_42403/m.42969 type:complete len:86 (-) Transcript_42403:782-1039(-)
MDIPTLCRWSVQLERGWPLQAGKIKIPSSTTIIKKMNPSHYRQFIQSYKVILYYIYILVLFDRRIDVSRASEADLLYADNKTRKE